MEQNDISIHPVSSSIYLYAELLLNIRKVSVIAILPSNCNEKTRVWLDNNQRTLTLKHEDEEAIIELPCSVLSSADLKIHPSPTRELSFRLVISDATRLSVLVKQATDYNDPWPAVRMTTATQVACKSCRSLLIKPIDVWKYLPSAGWADMMDFWHCHKPSTNTAGNAGSSQGYAAANVLSPTAGIGLVDISHLIISHIDAIGLKIADNEDSLYCTSCRAIVGVKDKKDGCSLQLFKWSVALQRSKESKWETCSVEEIVSAQLLALIEDLAVHKFLAFAGDAEDSKTALELWVLNPGLIYSTSTKPTQRAMKILYSTITDPSQVLEKNGDNLEELNLPIHALKTLQAGLNKSTNILPLSIRTHREWTVGLLDRWTPIS